MGGDGEREAAGRLTAFVECWDQLIGTKWLTNDVEDTRLPAVALADLRAVLDENARMREYEQQYRTWLDDLGYDALWVDARLGTTWRPAGNDAAPQQPARDTADGAAPAAPRDWWRTRGACCHCGCDVHQDDPAANVGDGVAHARCQQRVQEYEAEGAAREGAAVGLMRVPLDERTEAIRAHYDEFGFSGPTDLDRERDQVIGHLLGKVTDLGEQLAAANEKAETAERQRRLATSLSNLRKVQRNAARARLAELGDEWSYETQTKTGWRRCTTTMTEEYARKRADDSDRNRLVHRKATPWREVPDA